MTKDDKYEKQLIAAIKKYQWMRWSHIDWDALSFSRGTAYNHNLNKLDPIKEAFEQNRSKGVNYLLKKWIESDNATLQIAAMRLIAEEDDRKRLNQQYMEHSGETSINITIDKKAKKGINYTLGESNKETEPNSSST